MKFIRQIPVLITLLFLAACGGGGDTPSPTTAKLTVVLQGSDTAAASIKGIQTTIILPDGVTMQADAATGEISNGVITPAVNAPTGLITGKYIAAVNGIPATINIGFAAPSGAFAAGDVMSLNFDLAPGVSAPSASGFTISRSTIIYAAVTDVPWATLALH